VRALAVVRSLPEHSLIDRLLSGRAWIPVIGLLLVGIVAMQVEVLKLGTHAGKLLQRSTALQTENESLQASVASLGDDQRIERLAAGMGMVMPAPTTITFLRTAPGRDPGRAVANLHAPDPATFATDLAAQAAAAAAASTQASAGPSTPAPSSTSTAPGTTSTPTTAAVAPPTTSTAATSPTASSAASTSSTAAASTTAATAQPATQSATGGSATASATPTPSAGGVAIAPASSSQPGSSSGG
jgi:cell division protein FtsL